MFRVGFRNRGWAYFSHREILHWPGIVRLWALSHLASLRDHVTTAKEANIREEKEAFLGLAGETLLAIRMLQLDRG